MRQVVIVLFEVPIPLSIEAHTSHPTWICAQTPVHSHGNTAKYESMSAVCFDDYARHKLI